MSGRSRWIILVILVVHVALTVWLCAVLSISVDESYSLHTTSLPFLQAVHQALVWELQPPLYFASLDVWRHLGSSIFTARLLSVIAVAIAVYVMGLAARRYLSEHHRPLVMAVVAFNPAIVAAAANARVYGFVFLWSALLVWLFYEAYCVEGRLSWQRVSFAVVASAAIYTQYYTGFLLPAFAVVLIIKKQWRDLGAFAASMITVAVTLIPLVFFIPTQIHTNSLSYATQHGFVGNLVSVIRIVVTDMVPLVWSGHPTRIYAALAVVLVILIWRAFKPDLLKFTLTPAVLVVTSIALFAAAVTVAQMPILPKYTDAFHMPAYILGFGLISAMPTSVGRRVVIAVAAAALIATSIASLALDLHLKLRTGAAQMTEFIAARETPNERIGVFGADLALPLAYYYQGPNQIVPIPRPIRFDRFDYHDQALTDERQVREGLGYHPGSTARLWLVTSNGCIRAPVNFHCELLEDFVTQHYVTLRDQLFWSNRVRELRQRP